MPMETELKYLDADLDAVRDRLHAWGADFQARRFETNTVFDDAAKSLKARGILVRLRSDGREILTLKRPPQGPRARRGQGLGRGGDHPGQPRRRGRHPGDSGICPGLCL